LNDVAVVGEATTGAEALALVEELHPDVLLADITMPEMSGLELAEQVSRDFPATRTIILSMHTEKEYAMKALRAGASGYLVKDAGTAELELAIRAAVCGGSYLSAAVSKHIVPNHLPSIAAPAEQSPSQLTPRQLEVLKLVAEGNTTKAIARRLDISVKTADTHRVQLMERLGIHDVAGLVRYAIKVGLVKADA
jgi:DNA-binding NarL/FixJ family response regulator